MLIYIITLAIALGCNSWKYKSFKGFATKVSIYKLLKMVVMYVIFPFCTSAELASRITGSS